MSLNEIMSFDNIQMIIPKSIIDIYKVHIHIYLDLMEKSTIITTLSNENELVYYGWKLILHIMSIMFVLNRSNADMNKALQEGYLFYLEYLEQIYSKKFMMHNNPCAFVMKTILGHISFNNIDDYEKNKENYKQSEYIFTRITKWTNVISLWNNNEFTTEDRQILNVAFLSNYLENMTGKKFYFYKILEHIQDIWKDKPNFDIFHVVLLDKFYKKVMSLPASWNHKKILEISSEKFVCERSYVESLIENIQYNQDVDILLNWIFS